MIVVGIDPGKSGAIAALEDGKLLLLGDAPLIPAAKGKEYDTAKMTELLDTLRVRSDGDMIVGLELVHAMPGQGVTSMFTFGRGLGLWQGIVAGLGLRLEMVTPQRWQKVMLDGRGKDASIVRARELFPDAPITLKKHHGRADALLIAEYVRRTCS